jgi:hypothetical protein
MLLKKISCSPQDSRLVFAYLIREALRLPPKITRYRSEQIQFITIPADGSRGKKIRD